MALLANELPRSVLQFWERHGARVPPLVAVIAALLLARLLAELVALLLPIPENAQWRPAPAAFSGSPAAATNTRPNADLIANAHFFGDYQASADATADQMSKAPDTRLNLNLLGIFASDTEGQSRALIGAQDGDEQPYAVGQDVVAGVKIQAIFPDRVILARNGQLETLRLDKDRPGALPDESASSGSSVPSTDTSAMLGAIREKLLNDPSKAADYIRIQPANTGGQQRGYRIYPGRDRSVFNGAGLRPGDLVTSINGQQLDDPSRALQMMGEMSQARTLNLTVERGGAQQAITVNLN